MRTIKIKLLLLITLVLLTIPNGFSQNSTAWNTNENFQFQVNELSKDTIVILKLSKPDLKQFRLYVTELEHIQIQFEYTKIEYSLLENKFGLLTREKDNYKLQLELKDRVIGLDQKYLSEVENFYKKENKLKYREGLYKGGVIGIIFTLTACLILN